MRIIITLCFIGALLSCNNKNGQSNLQAQDPPEQENENTIHNGSDGIVMELTPDTYPVGTDKLILKITNHTDETIQFGASYNIEKQDEETQQWANVPLENLAVIAIMYMLAPGESQTYDISIYKEDMNYMPGRYRIKKQFFVEEKNQEIYAEFLME